jgi:pimeloyl-ACP methyl ester carboxylesterase
MNMSSVPGYVWFGVLLAASTAATAQTPPPIPSRQGIIFVVDGAGGSSDLAKGLAKILADRCAPFTVQSIRWCKHDWATTNHKDFDARIHAARTLAGCIAAHRAVYPQEKIVLIGNSTGTHVVLAATEMLPADSVERIVVMASTVSAGYDLRPALRCSRDGVVALFSREDNVVAVAGDAFGTADRRHDVQVAGENGFAVPRPSHPDADLFRKLRQVAWDPSMEWTGHLGGHAGFLRPRFVSAYVVPLLLPELANHPAKDNSVR